jgi:hypothetical protein
MRDPNDMDAPVSLRRSFISRFKAPSKTEYEILKDQGEPLFTKEQLAESPGSLDRILRRICIENNISKAYFMEKYKEYAINKRGMFPSQAANNRTNLLKALYKGNITYKLMMTVLDHVLGFKLDDMKLVIKTSNGTKSYGVKE